ncbi:T9SS type A sorting domain-containing protein [Flavobacterium sp. TP390]|uniref:T9SS type A sorting domain-containing protein n=1 Tax=Flavobacterium profundi TaxID=1774945 RepID=A0A6I4ITG9_9FLAO|nr:T9SS type A sorting domain-containing protein [Flavobacterium profundi]MVO10177.1 T9SS type A sorting domain-containing protein [Flavobacterium profundi]
MKLTLTLFALFLQLAIFSQSNTVTSGATATGTFGSATYSIGQIDYQTNSSSNGTISQGVQQAFEIVTLGTNTIPQIQLTALVYPNPTVQNVTLSIKEYDLTNLNYQLFDMQGRIITSGKIIQNETQIEMSDFSSAHYFLKVSQANNDLKIFKIIKK